MTEHLLTHSRAERKRFDLGDVGSLRYEGLLASRAVATAADGATWRLRPDGARRAEAIAADGAVAGRYDASKAPDGRLTWAGRELIVRPARGRRARWTVHDRHGDDRELAALEGRGTGPTPATIALPDDADPLDPGLLLFLAFLVRKLAKLRTAGLGSH